MLRINRMWVVLLTGLLAASGTAIGQTADTEEATAAEADDTKFSIEEVIVTARKRDESILEVPIAITALTADDISRSNITSIRDLNNFAPGLNFQSVVGNGVGGRSGGAIIFRGMAPAQGTAREQSGAVFVDGLFVGSGVQSIDTSDVERIEVLRGPQNAYFGRNTFGGAINFVTRTPGDTVSGGLTSGASERGGYEIRGNVEGPLVEGKLSGRISGAAYKRGWKYRANDGGELGHEETESVTGTLFATPLEDWSVRLRAHFQRDDDGPMTNTYLRGTQFGSLCPDRTFRGTDAAGNPVSFVLSRPYFCDSLPKMSELPVNIVTSNTSPFMSILAEIGQPSLLYDIAMNNSFNNPRVARAPRLEKPGLRRDITRISLQSDYTFPNGITFAVNAGYEQSDSATMHDNDRTDLNNAMALNVGFSRIESFEVRLQSAQEQRLRWLIGFNHLERRAEGQQLGYRIASRFGQPTPTVGYQDRHSDDRSETPAVFAAVEFDLLENLTFGGEVRRQEDKSSLLAADNTRTEFEFTDTLPRVFLRWGPLADLNVYATWGKGVMPGQLNSQFIRATPEQQAEICAVIPSCGPGAPLPEVTNREIGVKHRLLDGRLQYSVSVYDMDWVNINTNQSVVLSTPPFLLSVVAPNDARLRGLEFESRWLVTPEWDIGLNFSLQDNEYTKFHGGSLSGLTSGVVWFNGNEMPKQPDRTATLSSGYRAQFSDTWSWYLRGEATYTGAMWDSEANIVQSDPFTLVNARFGIERDNLRVELFARNLFDDDHWTYISRSASISEPGSLLNVPYPTPTSPQTTVQGLVLGVPDPREIGLRIDWKF
ncbi:MAG TPA: TonB-dependent receptor [Steroidobacteraceae bacterium]|nr:TonB-dependent receptor [Steroidobacteraceae bacterium]